MKEFFFTIILIIVIAIRPILFVGIVGNYSLNINEIIEKYCINKDKPQLKCNGQCHLRKQLSVTGSSNKEKHSNKIEVALAIPIVFFEAISQIDFSNKFIHSKDFIDGYQNLYGFNYLEIIETPPKV
ncbi:hypothetical protein [Aquimarina agarivorans]|uniref:hypothetical protein n=1 Tax=Aquimarina agarivorans TaxID=980584 RepID=UPI000248EC19|nr:hypothetical protein [Aquimarina agarivorans]